MQTNQDLFKKYKEENDRYNVFKDGLKLRHSDNRDFRSAIDQMTAMRKNHLIRISKFKYGFI
jgi:hypothetical protein